MINDDRIDAWSEFYLLTVHFNTKFASHTSGEAMTSLTMLKILLDKHIQFRTAISPLRKVNTSSILKT